MKLKEWGLMRHRRHGSAGSRREKRQRSKSLMIVDGHGLEDELTEMAQAEEANDSPKDRVAETEEWQIDAALPSMRTGELGDIVELAIVGSQE